MRHQVCQNCDHWDMNEKQRVFKGGLCRKNPPTITRNSMDNRDAGRWPRTDHFDWCGEFMEELVRTEYPSSSKRKT